jgi:signal peptidase
MKTIKSLLLLLVCLALVVPAVLLASGKLSYKVYVVHTGSMSPTIPPKSAVIVKEGVYRVGQVITFRTANGVVTHRLIKQNADGTLVTKGDANRTVDPGAPLQPSQVVGGVVAAPRMVGYWLWYLKSPIGMASFVVTIICLWLIYSLTTMYAKRAQQTRAAVVEQGSRARDAAQKEPVVRRFVEWPLDADAPASWSNRPKPSGGPEQTAHHGSASTDGEAAIPESMALSQSALEPARNKVPDRIPPHAAYAKVPGAHRPICWLGETTSSYAQTSRHA